MKTYVLKQITGLPQLLVLYNEDSSIMLVVTKVVDDFLLAGTPSAIQAFHDAIAKRFAVENFVFDKYIVFNRLHIPQESDGSIFANIQEYLDKIEALSLTTARRKQASEKAESVELTAY